MDQKNIDNYAEIPQVIPALDEVINDLKAERKITFLPHELCHMQINPGQVMPEVTTAFNSLMKVLNAKGISISEDGIPLKFTDVKQIRLFNYKIISENNLTIKERAWWLSDRLIQENGFYFLEIDIEDFDSIPQNYTFKIKFERAEVDR